MVWEVGKREEVTANEKELTSTWSMKKKKPESFKNESMREVQKADNIQYEADSMAAHVVNKLQFKWSFS